MAAASPVADGADDGAPMCSDAVGMRPGTNLTPYRTVAHAHRAQWWSGTAVWGKSQACHPADPGGVLHLGTANGYGTTHELHPLRPGYGGAWVKE